MPLPLTVSCFSKIKIGFTFLILAYPGSPGKGPLNDPYVYVYDNKVSVNLAHRLLPKLQTSWSWFIDGLFLGLYTYLPSRDKSDNFSVTVAYLLCCYADSA